MDMIMVDKKLLMVLNLIKIYTEKDGVHSLREVCSMYGYNHSTLSRLVTELGPKIFATSRGRNGGIALANTDITIGEIAKATHSITTVTDSPFDARLSSALNRIARIKIIDLIEKDE